MPYSPIIECAPIVHIETETETVLPRERNNTYVYQDVIVRLEQAQSCLNVFLTAQKTRVKRIYFLWNWQPAQGVRIYGDAWERGYGNLSWQKIKPAQILPWYFLAMDRDGVHAYGVKTEPSAFCHWRASQENIQLCMDVRNGSQGVLLSGRELPVASVVARKGKKGESAFDAACAFCRAMCCHPRLPKQYIYGSNNWYYAYGNSSQLQIMKDAALLAELSDGNTVRPFLVIDDGWQISRTGPCNGGPWDKANPKFPDIKKLAEDIKSLKLHPGIWFRPLLTSNRPTDVPCLPHVSGKDGWVLDPSHPDALINIERMTQALVEWGFELLKHDFTTYDIFGRWGFDMGDSLTYDGWHFYNQSKTTAEIITDLYQAIRRGAGDRTLLLGCNTISHLSAGYFELMRTGDDTSGHEWERTRKMGVNTLAFRMPQHQAFYACDADCVGITDQIDWTLNREWLRLLSISGTPLFVSIDPDQTSEEQKNEIRNAFRQAIHTKGCAEPLNWTDTSYPEKWRVGNEIMTFCFSSIPLSDGEISVCQ